MRAANRLISVLLAVAIAVAGVLTVIEIVAAALDKEPVFVKWKGLVDDLSTTEWKTAAPRVAAGVLIVLGLLLLFFALRRGKPATVPLTTSASDVDMTTTRRSLQRSLGSNASDVDGIHDASAKVKRRKIVIKAQTTAGVPKAEAKSRLGDAIQQRLDTLSLAERRRVVVKVSSPPESDIGEAPKGLADSNPDVAPVSGGDTQNAGASAGNSSTSGRGGSA
ncbi:MAG: hypothetical protein QOJ32_2326 [Frankiaceae bacterium]|jgi:hypothetical protein|nr:hypothetical protein [Frankiaceae bacterium]MDQ1635517.1 hypothetical protein [Frankiaceae bacterium]